MNEPTSKSVKTQRSTIVSKSADESAIERVVNSRWTVLILLFGVLGVLGVPLLWVSRGFSRKEKIFWSIAVTIYTLALIAIAAGCIWFAWAQWQELMGP